MVKPDFRPNLFVLGAAKCGTTTIHNILKAHPDICMSEPKEPFFFESEYEKGFEYCRKKYYSNYTFQLYAGESRHRNLYLPYVAKRIKESCPNAKLVVILRDPADRALSHWWHLYSRKIDTLDFNKAIEEDMRRIKEGKSITDADSIRKYCEKLDNVMYMRTYVDSGYYLDQLKRYEDLFGRESMLILFTEELEKNFESVCTKLFAHLGLQVQEEVEASHDNIRKIMQPSSVSAKIARISRITALVSPMMKEKVLKWTQSEALMKNKYRSTMKTLKDHYKPHNEALSKWIGLDLSHWNA